MELLTLCRSCMVEVASWELQNFDGDVVDMFTFCTNVMVSEDDKLPKKFCCDCKIKIESSYTFIRKAQEVNVTLKNLLSTSEETNVSVKSENLTNDLQYNESNSLEPDSGFNFEVKIDRNEEALFSPNSNQSIEYKMEFDIYQTSSENSENELDESLSNKEFDLHDPKLDLSKDDFDKHSDRINDDEPHIVQKTIVSKINSNFTNNNKRQRKKKDIQSEKKAPELEISLGRKTNSTRTRIQKSCKLKTIKKGKGKGKSNKEKKLSTCDIDIYQTSPENLENEVDESLINKEFDLPDMKPNSNTDDFNKHSDRLHDDDPHTVQKIISEKDSNCTSNIRNRKRKYIIRQKEATELEISLRRKTNNSITRVHKSNKFKTIEKGKEESNEEENFFQCDICKQRYKFKKALQKHLETKHSKIIKKEKGEERPKGQEEKGDDTHPVVNTCDICDRTFKSNLWFTRHMKEHADTKQYFCKYCPKTFYSYHAYLYHTGQHAEAHRFACGECGARFKLGRQLAAHALAQKHARTHVCTKCGVAFKTKSALTSHMNSHVNERPYLCGICGYGAKVLDTLNNHMLTHTGEKPFSCKECAFRTSAPSSLRVHQQRHNGERPHACQDCTKRFLTRASLEKHIRQVHTGECPYECYLCPQAFTDAWKCKLHVKKAHSIPFEEIQRISKKQTPKK